MKGACEDSGNGTIKSPSFSHPPPPCTHSLNPLLGVYMSDRPPVCLFCSLALILSSPPKPFHKSIYYIAQLSLSFFFLCLKDRLLVQGTMTDKFSAHIHNMQIHASFSVTELLMYMEQKDVYVSKLQRYSLNTVWKDCIICQILLTCS